MAARKKETNRALALAIMSVAACCWCGCQREAGPQRGPEKARRTNHDRYRDALEAVLRHHDDKRPAIVTFESGTRQTQFVQFWGSSRTGFHLAFDLPKDKAEAQRAESLFQEAGIRAEESNAFEDPAGEPTRRLRVFRKDFGKDVEAAVHTTEQIFQRVYQLPADFPLRVICPRNS